MSSRVTGVDDAAPTPLEPIEAGAIADVPQERLESERLSSAPKERAGLDHTVQPTPIEGGEV